MSRQRVLKEIYKANKKLGDPGDAGSIVIGHYGQVCEVTTAAAETRTLAQPSQVGLLCGIVLDVDAGDLTLTVTGGFDQAGNTALTFDDAGDSAFFISIEEGTSQVWRLIAADGTSGQTAEFQNISPGSAVTAEHGAGAIGTGVAPVTYRYTRDGVIITEIQIDLTGLVSKDTANDIIGKSTTPAIFGRNVVATNGIIFKIEMICLEVPATGDTDIDLVSGSAADDAYDEAVTGAAIEINGGTWAAGTVVQTLVPAVAANYYYYLTTGAGATAGTYTTGQFMIRTYGKALLA